MSPQSAPPAPPLENWRQQLTGPAHALFVPLLERLDSAQSPSPFPNRAVLNALLDDSHLNAAGQAIRFVAPDSASRDEAYEARIFRCGEIATREHNWHDLFNALAWLTMPRTKRELNRLHCEHALGQSGSRGAVRDALTLFDESGVLIACSDASLAELLADFQWQALFVQRRTDLQRYMRFFVLGHALQEQMLRPYAGVTGKALILDCDAAFMHRPLPEQLCELDERTAQWISRPGALASTRALSPLPLLGIPGWDPANAEASYYDNTHVFRTGRRNAQVRSVE